MIKRTNYLTGLMHSLMSKWYREHMRIPWYIFVGPSGLIHF